MPNPSYFQKTLAKVYKNYSEDVGKALIQLGVVGWIFSALAQVVMLAKNDKISSKDKKFLIPQEIADGAVNVGMYFAICQTLKSYGDKLCEKGKIILRSTDDVLGKVKGDNQTVQNYIEGITDNLRRAKLIAVPNKKTSLSVLYEALIKDFDNVKELKKQRIDLEDSFFFEKNPIIKNKADKDVLLEAVKKAQSEFKANKNGIGVIATIGGSVLACNLITPVFRNLVANKFQKKHITNKTPQKAYLLPLSTTFNTFKM